MQRVRDGELRGDGLRMLRPEDRVPVAERRLEDRQRLGEPPGGGVGIGEPFPRERRLRVRVPEQLRARGAEGLPVPDGRVGEHRGLGERCPRPHKQRVRLGLPEHVAREGTQRGRVVPQRLAELRAAAWRAGLGPRLEQAARRRAHHLLHVAWRQVGADQGAHRGMQPYRTHRARVVHAEQPESLQARVRGAHEVLLAAVLRSALLRGDVVGRGGRGQDAGRDSPGVEHRGEDKRRPGQPGRAELVGVLDRQRPGGDQRGRATVDLCARRALHPLCELGPVVTAGGPCRHDHRGGLGERDRQPAHVFGQVERLDALVGIAGKPRIEVAERLPPAETRHGVRGHAGGRADGAEFLLTQPACDEDLACRPLRPQAVEVGGGGDAVEHDRPPSLGPPQPGQEPLRGDVGGEFVSLRARQQVQVRRRLRVAGHDRGAAARGDPDKQVDGARRPHRVREPDR